MERDIPRMQFAPERMAPAASPEHKAKTSKKHHVVDSVENALAEEDSAKWAIIS